MLNAAGAALEATAREYGRAEQEIAASYRSASLGHDRLPA